ncbi:ABC transporter permease [Streptomyces zaomyceticus]|uniref:ABC transporter permease n=1 Tax=Streptomyces zaomyceticus TaxID=68286 RepID=UPI002E0EA8AF|nr:ABC transporter permease subunit [Streptomyces zaomyceticus]
MTRKPITRTPITRTPSTPSPTTHPPVIETPNPATTATTPTSAATAATATTSTSETTPTSPASGSRQDTPSVAPRSRSHLPEPRPRFVDLVASEWVKLRSLRSTWIAYAVTTLAVIAFNAGTAYDMYKYWTAENATDRADFIRDGMPLQVAFTGNAAMVMVLALGAIGALAMVGEYSTGTVRTTFAAVPARHSVMAAKAVVVGAVATVFGVFVAGASFVLTQAILDGRGVGVPFGEPGAHRVVVASALLAPVSALAGMALGTVVRHTAATMITTVGVVLVLPNILSEDRYWSALAGHAMPFRAWDRLVDIGSPAPSDFAWSPGGAWTVYALWVLGSAAVAIAGVRRRDL